MRFYNYSCQLHNKALTCTLSDVANQIEIKYQLEKLFLIPYFVTGCEENHFYILQFGQTEASIY